MGLLDDLLGQLAPDPSRRGTEIPRASEAGTSNMSKVLIALLPVVLAMLANRQRPASSGQPGQTGQTGMGGGGLGDILGQVLGGSTRGASSGAGGLGELLDVFQRAGFGNQARSWVGTGRNEPISPEAFEEIFGRGGVAEIARRAGVSERDASQGLSQLMPEVVDRMTPDGQVPNDTALLASVESLARRLGV